MNKKLFDFLAKLGRIGLPALSVFYATVGKIWGLPFTEQIPPTITAFAVLLNAWLGIDSKTYWNEHDIVEINDEPHIG